MTQARLKGASSAGVCCIAIFLSLILIQHFPVVHAQGATADVAVDPPYTVPEALLNETQVSVFATILNWGPDSAQVSVDFYDNDRLIGTTHEANLTIGGFCKFAWEWTATTGKHVLHVNASAMNATDPNLENNERYLFLAVQLPTYDVTVTIDNRLLGQTGLYIDGKPVRVAGGGTSARFTFAEGTNHTISVDPVVNGTFTKYLANPQAMEVSSSDQFVFRYVPEYYLSVSTFPSGVAHIGGAGWYREGQVVNMSVPSAEILGQNGTKYEFAYWIYDNDRTERSTLSIPMNSPHLVVAEYDKFYRLRIEPSGEDYCGPIPKPQWYREGEVIHWSVPRQCPISSLLGLLGGVQITSEYSGTVTMTSEQVVPVKWYSQDLPTVFLNTTETLGGILGYISAAVVAIFALHKQIERLLHGQKKPVLR